MSDIAQWWPKLAPATQQWLIDNNGDIVPGGILDAIVEAGGEIETDSWFGTHGSSGFEMSDSASDWIEAVANGETPDAL